MEESNLEQNPNIQPQNNIPQPQPPVQPVENKTETKIPPSTKSKLPLMLIVIFVLLIILGSGGYYYLGIKKTSNNKACPDIARICKNGSTAISGPNCSLNCPEDSISITPTVVDETANPDLIGANWKTYTDTTYNFSVQYRPSMPPSVSRKNYDNSSYHVNFLSNANAPSPVSGESFGDNIEIRILSNPNKLSLLNYIKTEAFKNDLPQWNNNKQPTQPINLQNIDAIRIERLTGGAGEYGPVAFILAGDNIIEIKSGNLSDTNAKIFEQMLPTFKFTSTSPAGGDQNQTTDTSNWKTYRNTKYGYELKYPESVTIETASAKSSGPATGNDDDISVGGLLNITPVNSLGKCSDLKNEQAIISCLGSVSWAQQDQWAPITIGGIPAVRREITLKPSPSAGSDIAPVGYIYYVNSGGIGLQISFADSASRRPLMGQILSTFKFTP